MAACRRLGWRPLLSLDEPGLAGHERDSPGVAQALQLLERGEASALVASKRGRLPQALEELAALLASAQEQGWALVALDCADKPTTPADEAGVSLLASFAHCERRF